MIKFVFKFKCIHADYMLVLDGNYVTFTYDNNYIIFVGNLRTFFWGWITIYPCCLALSQFSPQKFHLLHLHSKNLD